MNREEKAELIKKLNSTFNNAGVVVVTHQSGLTVEESTDLRVKMREVGARYQVAKNRIVKLALKDTKYENIIDLFSGPTAIAVSEDPVSAPKTIFKFAKENDKLSIVGGGLDGKTLSIDEVKQLASLPSLEISIFSITLRGPNLISLIVPFAGDAHFTSGFVLS